MPYVLPHESATVRTTRHGEFHLDILSVRAFQAIAAIDPDLPPREYCVQVLHVVLQDVPERDADALRQLPDRILQRLAVTFATSKHGLHRPLPPKRPIFATFQRAVLTYLNEEQQRMRELLEGMRLSLDTAMRPITQGLAATLLPRVTAALQGLTLPALVLPEFKPIVPDAALAALSNSITSMAATVAQLPALPLADIARQVVILEQSTAWARQSQSHLADITRIAASASALASAQLEPLLAAVSAMSLKFGVFFDDVRLELANTPGSRLALDTLDTDVILPTQTSAIALGTVKVIGTRVVGSGDRVGPAPATSVSPDQLRSNIDGYLAQVQARFVAQWHGAWEALGSSNPDRLRQAAHSGRELLDQILHELAPESMFSPDELRQGKDGRPTRKMRIAKILLTTTDSSIVKLIEAQARLIDEVHGALVGVAHAHDTINTISDVEVGGYLMTLDGVLLSLFARRLRED